MTYINETMKIRREWLLQQLGILHWTLRRPMTLQVDITVPEPIRLLLVADPLPSVHHPLVVDVARSMALTPAQLYGITPKQAMMLPDSISINCWWLGLDVMRDLNGMRFHTPGLEELAVDACAKRELWHRIEQYI